MAAVPALQATATMAAQLIWEKGFWTACTKMTAWVWLKVYMPPPRSGTSGIHLWNHRHPRRHVSDMFGALQAAHAPDVASRLQGPLA
jgi:hypothetical protein